MLKQIALMGLISSCCSRGSFGQEFEVSSIRPSPELNSAKGPVFFGSRGGPGTDDPGRYWCNFCDVSDLISTAYGIPGYRLAGTKLLPATRFHVVATVQAGTTRDQFELMLQNLLAERFGLKVHYEKRQMLAYELRVSAGGVKLKPHIEEAQVEAKRIGDKAQPPGYHFKTQATLPEFAKVVENRLMKPVVDATGLTGRYDFDLSWKDDDLDAAEQSSSDLPTLRAAIQAVGLKIDSHKEATDVIVVDEIANSPTEN